MDTIARRGPEDRGDASIFPTAFQSEFDATLTDLNGHDFIDFSAGADAVKCRHNDPCTERTQHAQPDDIRHGLDTESDARDHFRESFRQIILVPRALDYEVRFVSSSISAIDAAIELARQVTGRSQIVAFTNAYHRSSLVSLGNTASRPRRSGDCVANEDVCILPFDGNLDGWDTSRQLERMLDDPRTGVAKPAAVILETVQCEGGIYVASEAWLQQIAEICQERNVLLIVDDIQVGNGRTGRFFSFEEAGIVPDIICLSQSIDGALPLALLLLNPAMDWTPDQSRELPRGMDLGLTAATAALEYWKTDTLMQELKAKGDFIQAILESIAEEHAPDYNFEVRGCGMVWGIDLQDAELTAEILATCHSRGLLIESTAATGQVVKVLAPLTISQQQLATGLEILSLAINNVLSGDHAHRSELTPRNALPLSSDSSHE